MVSAKSISVSVAILMVSALVGQLARGSDSPPTAEELLTAWANSSQWDQFVSMKVDAESTVSGNKKSPLVNAGQIRKNFSWYRDHNRMEAIGLEWGPNPTDPQKMLGPCPYVEVITDDQYLSAGIGGATAMYRQVWNGQLVTKSVQNLRVRWEGNPYLSGYLDGKQLEASAGLLYPQAMLANHPQVQDQMELVNGRECWRVDAIAPEGHLTAFIDPAKGNTAARYTFDIAGNDKLRDQPLASQGVDHISIQVDVDQIGKFGDWYIAMEGRFKQVSWLHNGVIRTYGDTYSRSDINLSPDFAAMNAFTLDVPDGTRVYYDQDPGIPYEIVNRHLRPRVDQKDLEELEKALANPSTQP